MINSFDRIENPRRRLLIEALASGLFAAGFPAESALAQGLLGSKPGKLPPGRSIFRISGTATVNGTIATLRTQVRPGDTVETGKNSELIFVVGGHSMIVRSETHLVIESGKKSAAALVIAGLRMLTGKILSVSRSTPMRVTTATASIGIRGTGFYAESNPEQTYFCTCYGSTEVTASNDPESKETVVSMHHDRPLYILAKSERGESIRYAPVINHTDQELSLIEALVGREPPFVYPQDDYGRSRRDY